MVKSLIDRVRRRLNQSLVPPADIGDADAVLWRRVKPFTMTGPERVSALATAVRYLERNQIPGAIVECGVWRGGSMMAVADTLLSLNSVNRDLYLFDTFAGMTAPSDIDVDPFGTAATAMLAKMPRRAASAAHLTGRFNMWCIADRADVERNIRSTRYPMDRVRFVEGTVEMTVPTNAPDRIALLRLDTDWYQSTRHELEHLYPRLVVGGVLIIDDYGHWQGARQAVDEYFASIDRAPLLHRIDNTGRMVVKP